MSHRTRPAKAMRDLLDNLMQRLASPKRLAPGAWEVTQEIWGAVHDYELAKLCVSKDFPAAEMLAQDRLAAAQAPGVGAGSLALALHDLACVLQVQGKFQQAIGIRKRFRRLARECVEHKHPGLLQFYEITRKKGGSPALPTAWRSPLYEIACAEEVLAEAHSADGQLAEALFGYGYAVEAYQNIGRDTAAQRASAQLARLRQRANLLSRLR